MAGIKTAAAAYCPRASLQSSTGGGVFSLRLYGGAGTWNSWGQLKMARIALSPLF